MMPDDSSPYSVTITVTDDGDPAKSAQTSFTWNVSAFNNAPTITAISDQTDITKDVISLQVSAADSDGDNLSYTATGLPTGLSISSSTGLISGTLSDDAGDNSPYSVTITVTDDGSPSKNAETSFTWSVSTFNNAPTVSSISDQTDITKDIISLTVSASDSDGDALSYSASGLPSGLSISSSSGLISGTISDDANDSSPYSITITVTDDGDPAKSDQTSFTWNVSAFNNAPTITALSDQTGITKDVISLPVNASDSDGDTLSYSATGLPAGLSIASSTGLISGTISDDADSSSPYNVTVTVIDDGAPTKRTQASFTWNVSAYNNAPTISAISDQTGITKDAISLQVSANDSDGDDLTYSATGLPTGLSIASSTGLISGTISDDADDSSPYSVTITVTDDGDPAKSTQASFTWNVSAFNHAPTITTISDQTGITKDIISLTVSASDSDGDTLSYSASGLPSGLSISSSSGFISGTISDDTDDSSPYNVTVTVTDDGSPTKSAQASFTWNISAFNNAPTIDVISTQTNIAKDVIAGLSVVASDTDGDDLTYSATGLPSGLSINSTTGSISGTISDDADDNSPYAVTITVSDDGDPAKSAEASFTWNVSAFNHAPTITAISDQTDITKDIISLQVSAADSDGDDLSYTAIALPSGLSINPNTGLISGTISDDANDSSPYSITITVTDDGDPAKSAQASFTWNVSAFNNAPTIDVISNQTNIAKDVIAGLSVVASDTDGDDLTYSANGLPSGLSISSSTGLISGTISDDANDSSPYSVTIIVTDDGSPTKNAQTSFTWNVTAFNNAPTITAISDQTDITKDVISLQVSANDSDGDDLSYTATGLPNGLSISSSTGLISGTLSDDAGDNSPYSVTITVTDNGSTSKNAETSFTWNVSAFNNAPTISAISDQTGITKDVISLSVSASDNDGDTISFSATGLPSGLSINSNTGLISGTISDNANDSSPYSVTVTLTDDGDPAKSTQTSFAWNVSAFNNAPTITAISDQTDITKDIISLSVSAADSDGDTLNFSATGLPAGLTIASSTGLISGTISDDADSSSPYNVTVTVIDDGAPTKRTQASFTWNVSAYNNAPTISAISDQTGITKDAISLQVSANDSDGDDLTYSATGLPTGLSIASSTGLISGTISDDANDSSPYSITITVTDDGDPAKSAQALFTWNVSAFNNAPTISAISDQTGITKDVISLSVSASDSDGDTLSYSATGLPSGLSIDSSTGLISGTISDDAGDNSSYSVTVTVTDDRAKSAQALFTWNVSTFNNAPTITAISDQTDTTKDVISLQVSAADSDGDDLSYTATGLPTGLSISSSTGLISGTISDEANDNSPYSVTVTVTDDSDTAKSATISLAWIVNSWPPPADIQIMDDGDAGFSASGGWKDYSGAGYQGDLDFVAAGDGSGVANWTFTGLAAGNYEVSVVWLEHPNRTTDAPYRLFDDVTEVASVLLDQQSAPVADQVVDGGNFQIIAASVNISSGRLVVELSNAANGFVIADAVRIELLAPAGPDTTAPVADLASPLGGSSIYPAVLNGQGYIEVTFNDSGDGIDAASIGGEEISISGTGVGTAVLDGTATLVSGTNYRYAFTGEFVEGTVDVTFVAGSFADLAATPNTNAAETESFTVATPPPAPAVQIMDDGDAGFSASGGWKDYSGAGYQGDLDFVAAGDGSGVANWTFTGLAAGNYEVSVVWLEHPNRTTDAPYRLFDDVTEVASVLLDQQSAPVADQVVDGGNFQIIAASVNISSGRLVVELSNAANGFVIADAVRIELLAPAGPDTTAPVADLASPLGGSSIYPAVLNGQGYIEVTFNDSGDGIDAASIGGEEISISGTGVGTAVLDGTATLVSGTNYRYAFTGEFVEGTVDVTFVAGSFADLAATPNTNAAETESFTVATPPPAPAVQIMDDGDAGFSASGGWKDYSGAGYQGDLDFVAAGDGSGVANWTFTGLAAGNYEVSVVWLEHPNRTTDAPYRLFDDVTEVASVLLDQQSAPVADQVVDGGNFQIIAASVNISSGRLVVELSNAANGFVIADAVRIELLAPAGPDTTAPVADLASPLGGSSIYPAVLNGQGYIEVTFNDSGDGIDAASIGGEEISISGTGVGTAVLDGTATLVSGTNYRYAFTGEFVEGTVDVTFVAGSFADLAATPNTNAAETESFTVATPPPAPAVQIMDDGDAGFSASGGWKDYSGAGYQGDLDFVAAGDGSGVANWTFTGLAAGNYEVSVVWLEHPNRTTDAPYRLFDDVTEVASVLLDQQSAPVADQVVDGGNFQIIAASVNISSGRLVVELSNAANGFVIADAVRIELLAPAGPDTTAPVADLASPLGGSSIYPAVLNGQGYIEVTFNDSGDGIDAASIGGEEISISGTGVGTAVLDGTATLVSGTNYRYAFTGEFVEGTVDVTFVAGSFADLAATPNTNAAETESFTVATPPPAPAVQIMDDGDAGFSASGGWKDYSGAGYQGDLDFVAAGDGSGVANWTFTGLAAGNYEVSVVWLEHPNRTTDAPYRLFDDVTEVASVLLDQQSAPVADQVVDGGNFQIIAASVNISSGRLVVELSNAANGFVIADAVRIELLAPAGPDTTAPVADLASPLGGSSIYPAVLNGQGYIEVTFNDSGDGIDAASIGGEEISISGTGVGTAVLDGTATLVSGTNYRYAFTGEFVEGTVDVTFVAGSFADLAATPNTNAAETESFTVATPPPAPAVQIMDDGDAGFSASGGWKDYSGAGYQGDLDFVAAGDGSGVANWTFTGLAAGNYEVSVVWLEHPNRTTDAPYRLFDDVTEVASVLLDQQSAPVADQVVDGGNFQIIAASVNISSGRLVVELSNAANGFVIADAVRIELLAPAGPDTTALEIVAANPAITSTESLSESSITEGSPINIYDRYKLAPAVLPYGGVDDATAIDTDGDGVADHTDLFPDDADFARISDYVKLHHQLPCR